MWALKTYLLDILETIVTVMRTGLTGTSERQTGMIWGENRNRENEDISSPSFTYEGRERNK